MTPIRYTEADLAYVTTNFVPLDELCAEHGDDLATARQHIEEGRLPRPTYVLPDGREMVPETYFVLADEAGGPEQLRNEFLRRCGLAASAGGVKLDPREEWDAYLSGEYGVCLVEVSPDTIVRKALLMDRIEQLLGAPAESDAAWSSALRDTVDELDALERPFAPHYDRLRFGGPSSRDRLITATRVRHPAVFDSSAAAV